MDNKKMVTVVVPAYNHEKYILECLESIHNQTYREFQWIVVDDCSTDKTPSILKDNKDKYGYELILHKKNMGISATLTELIRDYVIGDYMAICSSDDAFLPNKIEAQFQFLKNNPEYAMCYSRSIPMNESSEELPDRDRSNYKSGYIFEDVLCRKFFMGIDTMYRTDVLRTVGAYESGVIAEDYYMYSKIAQKYQIGFLDMYLYKYRVAELSKKRDPWDLVMSHRQTVEMYKDMAVYPKAVRSWEILSAMMIASYTKYKLRAIKYFVKNMSYFIGEPVDCLRMIKYLMIIWK